MSGGTLLRAEVFSGRVFRMTEKKLYVVLDCVIIPPRIFDTPFAGFLVHFESELLKRAHKNFDFRNGRSQLSYSHSHFEF
jgi:hypothetical protein